MALQVRPLHEHFGVEVLGFDFSQEITKERSREITDLADEHFLLLFRGQKITEEQHVALSVALGPVIPPVQTDFASKTNPLLLRVGNVDDDGKMLAVTAPRTVYTEGAEPWHTDGSFKKLPIYLTIFHGLEIPPERGDTGFASTIAAYEALSPDMKAFLADKKMTHPYPTQGLKLGQWEAAKTDVTVHPMVRQLPRGKKALYLANPYSLQTTHNPNKPRIVGMEPEESDKLFMQLVDFVTSGPFTYTHKWQLGDTLVWNNRGTLHSARGWDRSKHRRLMQRSEIAETVAPA